MSVEAAITLLALDCSAWILAPVAKELLVDDQSLHGLLDSDPPLLLFVVLYQWIQFEASLMEIEGTEALNLPLSASFSHEWSYHIVRIHLTLTETTELTLNQLIALTQDVRVFLDLGDQILDDRHLPLFAASL